MASRAHLDFAFRMAGRAARGISSDTIDLPGDAAAFIQSDGQTTVRFVAAPIAAPRSPRHMVGSWAVARLAGNVNFRVSGGVSARAEMVVFAHVGRMTVGAHEIPVLVESGPMQWVACP